MTLDNKPPSLVRKFKVCGINIKVSVFEAVEKSLSAVLNHPMKASLLCPWGTEYHVPKTSEESKLLFSVFYKQTWN